MSTPTVTLDVERRLVLLWVGPVTRVAMTCDEAQRLAERLTDAVDDAERVTAVGE